MIIVLKCTVTKMESHTLEILQQGVWASLTGGWFYDLRQNVFCNTFHLYLWLFLLCFPFILHLYFAPSIIIYSFYCGTVGVLFTVLKLINHRLHNMFDTSECIQETVPGEDLPESQKKRLQPSTPKPVLEDEGIELQVLNGSKPADAGFSGSFNEQTDDDSIISLEVGARPVSSTIDLKVDVHRKNSSESSEELSLKPVLEFDPTTQFEGEEVPSKKQSQTKVPDSGRSGLRCKYNQLNNTKLRSKVEEGITRVQDDDFALSQSDCHIAKLRKENMEELTEEYKMSQSDCHISNLRQSSGENNDGSARPEWSPRIPKHFNSKDPVKRKHRRGFYKNLHSDSQPRKNLVVIDKNKSFDMGDLASNGSCGVLTSNQSSNREQIKNTGSLELPLRDVENTSSLEKGLLYWKQQNLDRIRADKLRQSHNMHQCDNQKICSDTSIHSSDIICTENTTKRLNKASDLNDSNGSKLEMQDNEFKSSVFYNQDDTSRGDSTKEKSFLQILEENFDWYSSEYQSENLTKISQLLAKAKDVSKYKSEETIKEEDSMEDKRKSGLKFQVDSDEDSSDNCGSRSPLLCRHESLEKYNRSPPAFLCGEKQEKKIPRIHSNEEKHPRGFGKIGRTLSVDENVVLSKKDKNCKSLEKNSLSSFLLSVYDDNEVEKKEGSGNDIPKADKKSEELSNRLGKSFTKRESFLHRNKKLSLPISLNVSESLEEPKEKSTSEADKKGGEDVFSWGNERVGLDWLFEHTDSETENTRASFWKYTYSEDSDNTSLEFLSDQHEYSCSSSTTELPHAKSTPANRDVKNLQNQGAIPKSRTRHSDGAYGKRSGHQRVSKKSDLKYNLYPDDYTGCSAENGKGKEGNGKKKPKAERENGIIDEEDVDILQEISDSKNGEGGRQKQKGPAWRETYDSSSSSTTELSSLLPLSSLLSSLNPPTSPLLAAFLTARKEIIRGNQAAVNGEGTDKEAESREEVVHNVPFSRSRHRRNKRCSRDQGGSRSSRVSSLPLAALSSVVSSNSGTHIATSHDDTSQGAVHCFQDERGNWMSYTFDSLSGNVNHFPVPLPKTTCTKYSGSCANNSNKGTNSSNNSNNNNNNNNSNNNNNNNNNSNNNNNNSINNNNNNNNNGVKSGTGDNSPNCSSSKFLQPILRTPYAPGTNSRGSDVNFPVFINVRAVDEAARRQSQQSDRRKLETTRGTGSQNPRTKTQKSTETWDSSINLVSNSNSENESSLSLNSTAVSPNVDVSITRPAFASFAPERFSTSRRTLGVSPSTNTGSNSSSVLLSLSEFRNNDNNNISNNNNEENSGLVNFYSEAVGTSSVRLSFGLVPEGFLERNRHRTTFHSPTIIQDSQLSVSVTHHGNEQENDRNHFRLFDFDDIEPNVEVKNKPRHYYKLYYTPWNYLKIRFDRLDLMALLDRNLTVFEIFLSLFLSIGVSVCGIVLLNYGFYQDLFAFLFCFALAGCQYSLLKSVQPDATSPTHGYNRVVIYSRSIYFCITSVFILLLTENLDKDEDLNYSFQFYSIQFTNNNLIRIVRDGLVNLLLFFPVLFTLGLFPQINTFCLYLLEQIDMHLFGGNAMSSLVGAVYCVLRSVVTAVFVYGFAYGALSEPKGSQHILYSIFCGLLISLSYHLSRSSSNPAIVWDILKNYLFQDEFGHKSSSKEYINKKVKRSELDKSVDESLKSEVNTKTEGDEKSEDRNSQNNLLLNSNPSSNEMLKTVDSQMKSAFSENFDNLGSGSEIGSGKKEKDHEEFVDPLPGKLKQTVNARLKNDAIVCSFVAVLVFGIHCSTVFTALQPDLNPILWGIAGCSGIVLHYIVPELRKHLPWLCLAKPVLKCHEHGQFEVKDAARVMWFEETYVLLRFLERNVLYPVVVLAALTYDGPKICKKLGVPLGAFITSVCGLKVMRSAFSNTSQQYLIVIFSALLFEFDYSSYSETFLVDYFFLGIIFAKTYEFLLKVQFVVIYIAPWQITWGSAFHAFAQPFSVPHSAMLFIQAAVSAFLSAPLNPFLGSAIFLASYVRPIKFWERDYNTKRVDHSNTRLSSHLERNLGSDDNNLNSIFYEHLTRSLQHSLCGDLELGRWGPVYQGDCFVLASDYLNCLVHIIEMGNGLVTFQMRGLEFRGTYCQQREVEAISERVEEDDGCCCCEPGHIPHILSVNAAFSKRWLAWEVTAAKYVLEGYSISDNSAASTLQAFDFRKVLVTYYVKSIIFYCVSSAKLQSWLTNPTILEALKSLSDKTFVDLDPAFNINIDQDFDTRAEGITRNSFCSVYLEWIQYCCSKRQKPIDKSLEHSLVSLCLALSLMGRRTLGTASHNTVSSVEFFLYGLHALFKGDFRITSTRDDWVFTDMEFLVKVVAPGVRMSLKLHQDHFMSPEEYEDPDALYDAISNHQENLVISHEGDPAWRSAVLSGTPSLLALRHVLDDGTDEYKIIMLNKRFLSFRVIKLNRECVRGLWAGQQQELVFFRNRNSERGSIQNAKQVLRNMINSSCDQPIGYPIYVSPLTTSYSDTNKQYTGIIGGPLSLQGMKTCALKIWRRIRQRCREGCSSGSAGNVDEGGYSFGHEGIYAMTNINVHSGYGHNTSGSQSMDSSQMQLSSSNRGGSLGRSSLGGRGSLPSVGKPSSTTLASLAGLLSSAELPKGESLLRERETSFTFIKERQNREEKEMAKKHEEKKEEKDKRKEDKEGRKEKEKVSSYVPSDHCEEAKEKEAVYQRVRIIDPNLVFDAINLGRRIDVLWPDEGMRMKGGRSYWKDWLPDTGMEGQVVHRWVPNHRDPSKRSNVDKNILLIKIEDKYVPIAEAGVQDLGVEV